MRSARVLVLAAAILAAAAGFFTYRALLSGPADTEAAAELLRLQLPDTAGKPQRLDQWRGNILIVNFWATWCTPCREEIPGLVRIQARHTSNGVQIVGIAIDSADKVRQFAIEFGIRYPLLIGGVEVIDLTRKLGNKAGGLPHTVILDRSGKVIKTRLGIITEAELESAIRQASG